VVLIPPLFPAC